MTIFMLLEKQDFPESHRQELWKIVAALESFQEALVIVRSGFRPRVYFPLTDLEKYFKSA